MAEEDEEDGMLPGEGGERGAGGGRGVREECGFVGWLRAGGFVAELIPCVFEDEEERDPPDEVVS